MRRSDAARAPAELRTRWLPVPAGVDAVWHDRLRRDRTQIVPWLDSIHPLNGCATLEIGSGRGASTFALAEQGASVTAVDVNAEAMSVARSRLGAAGLEADWHLRNAAELDAVGPGPFDLVVFWASLEHMTVPERRAALVHGWSLVTGGGHLVVIETPNRLWPADPHTSHLPFFNWLPDDLAFDYLDRSPRSDIRTKFDDLNSELLAFQRLGRGVSYHDFELALGPQLEVTSCLQISRRASNPLRRAAWESSTAGRTARLLHGYAPNLDQAWFLPYLYLALRKSHGI